MDWPLDRILAVICGGVAAYIGYLVLDMIVGLTGPPVTATGVGLLTGIEQSLSMLRPSSIGAFLLTVVIVAFLTARGR